MKRILFYGKMTPVQDINPAEFLLKDMFTSNSGNLLFGASVARTVMTEGVELVPFFNEDIDGMLARIEEINEGYECIVFPLANAFRLSFMDKLRRITNLVNAVRLPCYIIGVGVQASTTERLKAGFSFDEDVKRFVSAVLEKSALLGLRGQYTADYLQQLGFIPEQHFTVIGCPSAYIHGENCKKINVKPYDEIKNVSVNSQLRLPENLHDLIGRSMAEFQDVHFVAQDVYEFWAMYFPYKRGRRTRRLAPQYYPYSLEQLLWREGRVVGFLRARDWLDFMGRQDFSFGSRIHGNMAAVTAGTPAIIAASDVRILELARYHGIPYIWKNDVDSETHMRDLYENADFNEFERRYKKNFPKYVDFLNRLGIQHIYDGKREFAEGMAPYDQALLSVREPFMLHSCMEVPMGEKLKGFGIYPLMLKYRMERRRLTREK